MDLFHLRLKVIAFTASITFMLNFYYIYGWDYIYGFYTEAKKKWLEGGQKKRRRGQ